MIYLKSKVLLIFILNYVLIDKRKPITGMGCLEIIIMTREEFRANLYQTYVSLGTHDHVLIQEYINIAEAYVFDNKQLTITDQEAMVSRLTESQN